MMSYIFMKGGHFNDSKEYLNLKYILWISTKLPMKEEFCMKTIFRRLKNIGIYRTHFLTIQETVFLTTEIHDVHIVSGLVYFAVGIFFKFFLTSLFWDKWLARVILQVYRLFMETELVIFYSLDRFCKMIFYFYKI